MRTIYFIITIALASCEQHSVRQADSDSLKNKLKKNDSASSNIKIDRDNSWAPFHSKYSFNKFPAKLYTGKLAKPDFTSVEYGNSEDFRKFMMEQIESVPINFGGKYTIIEKFCGAMCSAFYMVDRITGKIFTFPTEGDGKWGYKYNRDSNLLVGNSEILNDSMTMYLNQWETKPEFYRWTGNEFESLR